LILAAVTLSACVQPAPEADLAVGVRVVDNTDAPLHFRLLMENGEWVEIASETPPGENGCLGPRSKGRTL
jgi:hypothetical protein